MLLSTFSIIAFSQHPTNLIASNITSSTVDLSWDASVCTANVYLRYRVNSATTWTEILNISSSDSALSLVGLTANTTYDWSVKCSENPGWQTDEIFTTASCNITNSFSTINATCNNTYDGTINTTASNGASPYTYSWNNGSITQNLTAVLSGPYSVTITDNLGCQLIDSVNLGFDNIKSISQTISTFIDTANPNYPGIVNGYHIWAYDTLSITNNGCDVNIRPEFIISHSSQAIQQNQLELRYYLPGIGYMNIPYDIDANGNAYGFWNHPSSDSTGVNITMFSTNQMLMRVKFKNQAPLGLYTAIWNTKEVDNQGNIIQTLTPNDTVSLTLINCNNFSANLSSSDITCFGEEDGSAVINNINNGSGNYTYSWSNGLTSNSISNLLPGNYFCNIIDTNWGCTDSVNVSITEPSILNATIITSDIICYGDSNGTATLTLSGGTGTLTVDWLGMNPIALPAGTYSVNVTDINSCIFTEVYTVNEPPQLSSTFISTNVNCYSLNDGSAIVNFVGGATGVAMGDTNYILGWDTLFYILPFPYATFTTPIGVPAGIYPYTATDLNGCMIFDTITITQPDSLYTAYTLTDFNGYNVSCFGDTNATIDVQINGGTSPFTHYFYGDSITNNLIQNLGSGTYIDSIVDANGCIFTETITLTEPATLNSVLSAINISCNGVCDGEIISSVIGGIAPYSYIWDNSQTTNNLDSLCAGNYTVTISDLNGCNTNLTITVTEPPVITYTIDSLINPSSYGGNNGLIHISLLGGNGNLSASWSGPNSFSSSTEDIENLEAGFYYLALQDSSSCMYLDTIEITEPSSLWMMLDNMGAISCFDSCDGSINIVVNGGDSVYTFNWIGPNGFTSTSEDITGLCAGEYILMINDLSTLLIDTFNIYQPQPLNSILTAGTITCYEGQATAEILVYGGSSPFQYNWSNGATNYYTNLGADIHTVEVTDIHGCILLDTITLINPDSISLQVIATDVSCNGFQDAEATLSVTNGGTAPFQYSADNGINYQTVNTFYNLAAGTTNYLVIDTNGCSNTITSIIFEPAELVGTINTANASCYGECNGTATLVITGGTPTYNSNWGSANPNNLCAGFYNVMVTDANGCLATNSTIITEPNPIIVNIWQNGNTIEATTGFISYQWYDGIGNAINGATNDTFTPTVQGEYSVEVTDINGCSARSYSILVIIDYINQNEITLTIYPNPTKGELTIESSEYLTSIAVLNSVGNRVIFIKNNITFEKQTSVDLSTFAKGIYFIQLEINNQLINHRIILQ